MTVSMERRLREQRSRVLIRSWDYRQRRHARGVWFRLRRVLADAGEASAIPREEARNLLSEGRRAEPVGDELDPPRLIVFASRERAAAIPGARLLVVRLDADLLRAEALALVSFDA